ncbi:MAG: ion transporter [Marinilabiliaceae bacterium]|nr:ion transporter [Marinilabiliaceae bacterium]
MFQKFLKKIVESNFFYRFIVFAILSSCFLVGWDAWDGLEHTKLPIKIIDKVLIFVFVFEVLIKIGSEGRNPKRYFNNTWNVFDFIITLICVFSLFPAFSAFRILRVLRIFRLFSTIPKLQLWVGAMLRSLPSIAYVFLLLIIILFTYGAMGVYFFADNDPFHFGTLPNALLSMFRVITFSNWTDIMYHNIYGATAYPEQVYRIDMPDMVPNAPQAMGWLAAIYFISFVLICVFIILNMFTGIVLSAIQEMRVELEEEAVKKSIEKIIGDKEEVINNLPRVTPDDFELLSNQLTDIQNKLIQFKVLMLENEHETTNL